MDNLRPASIGEADDTLVVQTHQMAPYSDTATPLQGFDGWGVPTAHLRNDRSMSQSLAIGSVSCHPTKPAQFKRFR